MDALLLFLMTCGCLCGLRSVSVAFPGHIYLLDDDVYMLK